jgi:hypothetical protein
MKTGTVIVLLFLTALFIATGCKEPKPATPEEKALMAVKEECKKAEPGYSEIALSASEKDWVVKKNTGAVKTEPENEGIIVELYPAGPWYARWIVFNGTEVRPFNGNAIILTPECEKYLEPMPKMLTDEERESVSDIPEGKRKEIYYELVKYEDENPDKVTEAESVIAERYGITDEQMTNIEFEGIEKNWPMPPAPY